MDYSVFILHFANVLSMVAWLVTDILWVRVIAVAGNIFSIVYYWQHTDLYQVNIAWHTTYIAINLVQIGMLMYQRRPIKFSTNELALFKQAFVGLSPYEFKRLLEFVEWRKVEPQTTLATRGEQLDNIMIIVKGKADVMVERQKISELADGSFIGEMSFVHGGPATADVMSKTAIEMATWDKNVLSRFLRNNPSISSAWQVGMGLDLVHKLAQHTQSKNTRF